MLKVSFFHFLAGGLVLPLLFFKSFQMVGMQSIFFDAICVSIGAMISALIIKRTYSITFPSSLFRISIVMYVLWRFIVFFLTAFGGAFFGMSFGASFIEALPLLWEVEGVFVLVAEAFVRCITLSAIFALVTYKVFFGRVSTETGLSS